MTSPSPWRALHQNSLVTLGDYRCPHHHGEVGREEVSETHSIAFVRRGMFIKHVRGRDVVADSNCVLGFNRGEEYRVSHPVCTGDRCTTLAISEPALREAMARHDPAAAQRDRLLFAPSAFHADSSLFLSHRLWMTALETRPADTLLLDELALRLVDEVLAAVCQRQGANHRNGSDTPRIHADLCERVKFELSRNVTCGISLDELASAVHASPFHLARVFRAQVGVTIHRYLVQLRLRLALDELLDGRGDLTAVAMRCGFSDHSHFTNAFRREFGMTPSACRAVRGGRGLLQLRKTLQASEPTGF